MKEKREKEGTYKLNDFNFILVTEIGKDFLIFVKLRFKEGSQHG